MRMPSPGLVTRLLDRLSGDRHRERNQDVSRDIAEQARRAQQQRAQADRDAAAWEQTEREAQRASRLAWEDLADLPRNRRGA